MPPVARRLDIIGRVQGVYYRNWTIDMARSLGLVGWVRNRLDGSVEALLQGEEAAVARMIVLAHEGPPAARVDGVDVIQAPVEDRAAFEKRPTA